MLFINLVEMMTSSKTGTLPPTKPVFPPWGQTAKFLLEQWVKTSDTSSVDFGVKSKRL